MSSIGVRVFCFLTYRAWKYGIIIIIIFIISTFRKM